MSWRVQMCDKPPHHIPGCESEDFCSLLACNEWLGFLDGLGKASLKVVRSVVELTLMDVAAAANTRSGARVSFTRALRANFGELKKRAEIHLITLLEAGGARGEVRVRSCPRRRLRRQQARNPRIASPKPSPPGLRQVWPAWCPSWAAA